MPTPTKQLRYPLNAINPNGSLASDLANSNISAIREQLSWIAFKQIQVDVSISEGGNINTVSSPQGRVDLYLPGGTSVTDGVSYNTPSLGTTGAFIKRGIQQQNTDIGSQVKAGLSKGAEGLNSMVDALTGGEISTTAVAKILSYSRKVSNGVSSGISSGIRAVANPHVQSVFHGVNIREFSFPFKLVPESEEEAREIREIIFFFRRAVYPSFGGDPTDFVNQSSYIFPNVFEICIQRWDKDTNKWDKSIAHKFLTCHLISVETNFDPNETHAVMSDGGFPEYSLTLNFQEERTLTSEDIEDGF